MEDCLARVFVSAGDAHAGLDPASLGAQLRDTITRARSARPELDVPHEDFVRYLGERVDASQLSRAPAADLFLSCACLRGDDAAIGVFEREFIVEVPQTARRVDPSPEFAREVTAATREKLLVGLARASGPSLTRYAGRGPLRSFVLVTAMRVASDLKRQDGTRRVDDAADLDVLPFLGDSPETVRRKDEIRQHFKRVFKTALASLTVRERAMLRLHFAEDISAEGIGKAYRVHRATATRWIGDARQKILTESRRLLEAELRLGREALDSLMGEVGQGLEITLSTFMRGDDE